MNIVLVEPEIPQNTGNIVRTCAATHTVLHLIEPLGFELSDKYLKRAGLDYWDDCELHVYKNLGEFFDKNPGKYYFASTKAKHRYDEVNFEDDANERSSRRTSARELRPRDTNPDGAEHKKFEFVEQRCYRVVRGAPSARLQRVARTRTPYEIRRQISGQAGARRTANKRARGKNQIKYL